MSTYRDAQAMARAHTLPELIDSEAELLRMRDKARAEGRPTHELTQEIDTTALAIHLTRASEARRAQVGEGAR